MIFKLGYVVTRQSALFSFPGLRRFRNFFYSGYLGTTDLNVDDFVRIGPSHRTDTMSLRVGPGFRVGRNVVFDTSGGIVIGKRVTVSEDAKIYTHDHVIDDGFVDWRRNGLRIGPLTIGDDAWVGAGAIVLATVSSIGRSAMLASASVIRTDAPEDAIVAGNPAKFVRNRRCVDEGKQEALAGEHTRT